MSSLDRMKVRAGYTGYDLHDNFNVSGKYKSFTSALTNSYQAEWITFKEQRYRCLINPDKLTNDYDKKEISIDFSAGMKNGDTFYWDRTDTHWMAYLQRLEEEAYFRAQIVQCDYEIDIDGEKYWIYVRGPVETALVWRQKHQIEFNDMNYSLLFYVTKDEITNEFFKRFQILKFDGHNWRVAATDRYSQDGLIEVYVEEFFDNEMQDNMVIPEIIKPDQELPHIEGPQEVKPFDIQLSYSIVGSSGGKFVVNSSKVKINEMNESSCVLEILTGKAMQFDLIYKVEGQEDIILPIMVKSF